MSESQEQRFEILLSRIEKAGKLMIFVVTLTAGGVLWGARLEWKTTDLIEKESKRQSREEKITEQLSSMASSMAVIESKLHGVSTLVGKSREDVKRTIQKATDP